MPRKTSGASRAKRSKKKTASRTARQRVSSPAAPSISRRLPKPTAKQVETARRKYEAGILERGEAVPKGMPLTPGATHEIVGTERGRPVLKRKRFSIH